VRVTMELEIFKRHVFKHTLSTVMVRSKMTINYRVIVKRYPFPNGVVGGSPPGVKFSLYLTGIN
jgi:hypothetical protein